MIDLKVLRDDPDRVRASQRARGEDETVVDRLLEDGVFEKQQLPTARTISKAERGHFAKTTIEPKAKLIEFRVAPDMMPSQLPPGPREENAAITSPSPAAASAITSGQRARNFVK